MVVVRSLDKSGNSSRSNSIVSDDYCLVEELEEFNSRGEPATTTAALINSAEKERSGLEEKVKQLSNERLLLVEGIKSELDATRRDIQALKNRLPAVASTRNYAFYEAFLVALGFFAVYCSLQGLKSWNLLEGNNLTASPQFEELKLLNERLKQETIDQQRMIVDLQGQLKLAELLATRQKQNVETQTDNGEMMEEKMRSLQSENVDLRNQLEHANLRNGQLNIELSVSKRTMKEGEIQLRRELDDARATINAQADRIAVLGQNIYQNEKGAQRPCEGSGRRTDDYEPVAMGRKQMKKLEKEMNMHRNRAEMFENLYKEARHQQDNRKQRSNQHFWHYWQ